MFDNYNIDATAARASVEYAKARSHINERAPSRLIKRNAKMVVVDVLHGVLEHRNGHTIVVFPDKSEAKF